VVLASAIRLVITFLLPELEFTAALEAELGPFWVVKLALWAFLQRPLSSAIAGSPISTSVSMLYSCSLAVKVQISFPWTLKVSAKCWICSILRFGLDGEKVEITGVIPVENDTIVTTSS
jgi:hypothetical protein